MKRQSGQTATEYMLIVAVVVLALVAAASQLIPKFQTGVTTLGGNIQQQLGNNPANCQGSGC